MQKKTVIRIMMVGCAAMLLTGCGIPKEDYDKVVKQVADRDKEITALKDEIAKGKEDLASEQAKSRRFEADVSVVKDEVKKVQGELSAEKTKAADAQQKVSALESELSTSKSEVARVQAALSESETALKELNGKYQNMVKRWEQFEKNLVAAKQEINGTSPSPVVTETSEKVVQPKKEAGNLFDGIK